MGAQGGFVDSEQAVPTRGEGPQTLEQWAFSWAEAQNPAFLGLFQISQQGQPPYCREDRVWQAATSTL